MKMPSSTWSKFPTDKLLSSHKLNSFFTSKRRILRNAMVHDTILSPIIDDISVKMKNKRQKVAGSWKKRMLKLQFKKWFSYAKKSHAIGILESLIGV